MYWCSGSQSGTNAMMTRDVGLPVCRAIQAFGRGNYRAAIEELMPVRQIAHRFGGSHAQRDVFSLTLIEAALRAKDSQLRPRPCVRADRTEADESIQLGTDGAVARWHGRQGRRGAGAAGRSPAGRGLSRAQASRTLLNTAAATPRCLRWLLGGLVRAPQGQTKKGRRNKAPFFVSSWSLAVRSCRAAAPWPAP